MIGCSAGDQLVCVPAERRGLARYEKLGKDVREEAAAAATKESPVWNEINCGYRRSKYRRIYEKERRMAERVRDWLKEMKRKRSSTSTKKKQKKPLMSSCSSSNSSCFAFRAMLECLLSCVVEVDVIEQ